MFTVVIDWIFQLIINIFNIIKSSWLTSMFFLIAIIGFIVDLVIASRSN